MEYLYRENITDNVVVIKINKTYRKDMTPLELYECTRGVWKRKIKSVRPARYALAVYKGQVVEVYKIFEWMKAGTVPMQTRDISEEHCKNRIEFTGEIAPAAVRIKYINKNISKLYKFGEADPVKTFFL